MNAYEKEALELAHQVAREIHSANNTEFAEDEKLIVNKLNLAKLLEDAAMLDWLEKQDMIPTTHKYRVTIGLGRCTRTAIRNAMEEK